MKTIPWIATLAVVAVVATAGPAPGAMMAYVYTGQINWVYDPGGVLDGSLVHGTPFSGSYTFESNMTDDLPEDPEQGLYTTPAPPSSIMTTTLGNYTFTGPSSEISVRDTLKDDLKLYSYDFSAGNLTISTMLVYLFDYDGTALTSDAIPLSNETLAGFAGGTFYIAGSVGDRAFDLSGALTSYAVVPEPATLVLFLSGMLPFRSRFRH